MNEEFLELFKRTAEEIFHDARKTERLIENPDDSELKEITRTKEAGVVETRYGNLNADSEPNSRSAIHTKNSVDDKFGEDEIMLLKQAKQNLSNQKIVSIDSIVGDGSDGVIARLVVPEPFAHIAYGGRKLFKPASLRVENPKYWVILFADDNYEKNKSLKLPQKSITIRTYHSPDGGAIKIGRNSLYLGEWKKGVFAAEDYSAKQGGNAIFLHGGCRVDELENPKGVYEEQASVFVALSANGKTTLTCKVLAKKGREKSWLIQDDGGTLARDSSFHGFEAGGIFVKTERLSPSDQIETYYAALRPNSLLENVYVNGDGEVDFENLTKTSNGRAVIERRDIMHASQYINVPKIHNLFIITRGVTIPSIAKLTPEEATAYMALGQSMESSAGDPTKAGQLKNEFFYDPFIAGNRAEHANLFYDIMKDNPHMNFYLINTGYVGEGEAYKKITLETTLNVLDSIIRGGLRYEDDWIKSEATGLLVPRAIRSVDDIFQHPERLYQRNDFLMIQHKLDKQRADMLDNYLGLHKAVREVFQHK